MTRIVMIPVAGTLVAILVVFLLRDGDAGGNGRGEPDPVAPRPANPFESIFDDSEPEIEEVTVYLREDGAFAVMGHAEPYPDAKTLLDILVPDESRDVRVILVNDSDAVSEQMLDEAARKIGARCRVRKHYREPAEKK
jgi:hypothetical protein